MNNNILLVLLLVSFAVIAYFVFTKDNRYKYVIIISLGVIFLIVCYYTRVYKQQTSKTEYAKINKKIRL